MSFSERPLVIPCNGQMLLGILAEPGKARPRAVVIVAGAPQYRVGSHRQFVILARDLATAGFPALRFDYRGIGDSDGEPLSFEQIDDDIRAAIDVLFETLPGLEDVVLWGLCDGASAAMFYAAGRDSRISGLVLVNPWVRSSASLAETRLKRYYATRLGSGRFWRDLITGRIALLTSARELLSAFAATGRGRRDPLSDRAAGWPSASLDARDTGTDLPRKIRASLRMFDGPVLIILCGADLTAQEFEQSVIRARSMASWLSNTRISLRILETANHTYSNEAWRTQVHLWTIEWLARSWSKPPVNCPTSQLASS